MKEETTRVRLLPWTGVHGRPALLLTDGEGGPVSRLADRIENARLGLADRLLSRTRDALTASDPTGEEFAVLAAQLADALGEVLLIAQSRGARVDEPNACPSALSPLAVPHDAPDGAPAHSPGLSPLAVPRGAPAHSPAGPRSFALFTLPGRDLASAPAARRHVRDTARSWGLSPGATDDLETIAGELVANALEHSDSETITVTCAYDPRTVTISVSDEGHGRAPVATAPSAPPGPEREHGRGLLITDALAVRWGTRRTSGGVVVWAEVATEGWGPGDESRSSDDFRFRG